MNIVFDIDDTLIDHSGAELQASLLFWRRYADTIAYTEAEFPQVWHDTAERHFASFLSGECAYQEQRRRRIRVFFGASISDAEADELFGVYRVGYDASLRLFPDVLPCLDALSGRDHTLAIISNNGLAASREKLARFGLLDRFTDVVTPDIAGVAKPDTGIFETACKRLDAAPAQCVYVGDKLDSDARGAAAAGWRGVWIKRDGARVAADEVTVIDDLRAVLAVISGSGGPQIVPF